MSISIINLPPRLLWWTLRGRIVLSRRHANRALKSHIWIKSITAVRRFVGLCMLNGTGFLGLFSFSLFLNRLIGADLEHIGTTWPVQAASLSLKIQHWEAHLNSLVSDDSLLYSISVSNKRITKRIGSGRFHLKLGQTVMPCDDGLCVRAANPSILFWLVWMEIFRYRFIEPPSTK